MNQRFKGAGLLVLFLLTFLGAKADEGMWIPILIEKYNIKLMQEKGFKLTAEDIYSINKASMKDAVMLFGRGCTGELISGDGLLITNHHCGFGQIQAHSSLEHDYLTDGFWAMNRSEELVNQGLTVTFLKYMEDVTEKVLDGVSEDMTEDNRERKIAANSALIVASALEGSSYTGYVRPFYMGNQYFLFVNEVFRDVRLVGAPPFAIGNFGSDTDNWVWPRHTGDFSLFRIYADKDNKPAAYSKDNVPYKPAYHFPVSMKGIAEGDFTMVFGYPGSTSQYVPSYHVSMLKDQVNPAMIDVRTRKLEIMLEEMNKDPLVRIKYASKRSSVSNSWKRWIGENQGLERMEAVEKKKDYEKGFSSWTNSSPELVKKYGDILPEYEKVYADLGRYTVANNFTSEVFFRNGVEAIGFASSVNPVIDAIASGDNKVMIKRLQDLSDGFFKNYDKGVDKRMFAALLEMYGKVIDEKWQSPLYKTLKTKYKGDFIKAAEVSFSKSPFCDQEVMNELIASGSSKSFEKLKKDIFYTLALDVESTINVNFSQTLGELNAKLQVLNRRYMAALMEYDTSRLIYPDANLTLRVSYGQVKGYESRDAVYYMHYTTLNGIIEKDNPDIYDYKVPARLKEIFASSDFGRYAVDGKVPVCFVATNHTTGGNSGSPVINGDGHLIGINFDRAWEGVASDLMFNPQQSRNISLDIRYVLFLIDKFAGAGYLLDEMTIIE